jgi:hypothetical protein
MNAFVQWTETHGLKISNDWLKELLDGLDTVHALPPELRTSLTAKELLADLVFEDARHRLTPEEATQIVAAFKDGICAEQLAPDPVKRDALEWFRIERNTLVHGLKRVNPETLRNRARTGLDRTVLPAKIDLPPAERVRQLIRTLQTDKELLGLSRLAHHLMAAVHIPRPISSPDELPVGGVSDISNRGPLDRLLVSELAHDDITLSVRIALNEALYLRRETPPRMPPTHRLLLIDSGIRLWGIPRVFATAVALAFAATANRSQIAVYRATGDGLDPVDLTTREGLDRHLEALEPQPHPASALVKFFALNTGSDQPTDRILITHQDVIEDPEFRAALRGFRTESLYLATVSRDGTFRLSVVTDRGERVVRQASLSLEDLLEPPKVDLPGLPLVCPMYDASLPAILTLNEFPLLMSHPVSPERVRYSKRFGAIVLTRDGRLMQWCKPCFGARQITDLVPRGAFRWFSIEGSRATLVVERHQEETIEILTADLETRECRLVKLRLSTQQTLAVHLIGSILMRIVHREVQVFDLQTGEQLSVLTLPNGMQWRHARFFLDRKGWYALGWDGFSARLDLAVAAPKHQTISRLFDRDGFDGPWASKLDGVVFSTVDACAIRIGHGITYPILTTEVSADGNRLAIRTTESRDVKVLDLIAGTAHDVRGTRQLAALLAPDVDSIIRTRALRCNFRGVSIDASGQLALVTKKNEWLSVTLNDARNKLVLRPDRVGTPVTSSQWIYAGMDDTATVVERPEPVRAFRVARGPVGTRYKLKVADWPNRSRAFLDSRGMLHLVGHDPTSPQITIVLDPDDLAVYCAASMAASMAKPAFAGSSYFIGDVQPISALSAYGLIKMFVESSR